METTKRRAPRADAARNIAAILATARECLVRDPGASIAEIAKAAGVGRVTLYSHFPSRADLVDAVFARAIAEADDALGAVDLTGDPADALTRLIGSSWQIVHQFRALLAAVQRELPPDRIRAHHALPMRRVERLLQRGRRAGVFRADLPTAWLVAVFYNTLHGAADEIAAGRLAAADAPHAITAILLSAFAPPA
jgi:TetR/AcrR family transcriptional regulator, mexCD-oprJ operon repressor